jgi:hypothetical protein
MSPPAIPSAGSTLTFRGINYDTGTSYVPGWHWRPDWSRDVVRADLATIRDDLHCNGGRLRARPPSADGATEAGAIAGPPPQSPAAAVVAASWVASSRSST